MAFVVFGAGAIGTVVGARLYAAGHEVTLVARGAHLAEIRASGLRVESPAGTEHLPVPTVGDVDEVDWFEEHVVLLAVKSQHTESALGALAGTAPASTPILCLQNGIANEPAALRVFPSVYGVSVACPTGYLQPGVVQAWSTPVTGLLDVGRYPAGIDRTAEEVASAFASATFNAHPSTTFAGGSTASCPTSATPSRRSAVRKPEGVNWATSSPPRVKRCCPWRGWKRPQLRRTVPGAETCCTSGRSTERPGPAGHPGRASIDAPATLRPTT